MSFGNVASNLETESVRCFERTVIIDDCCTLRKCCE